MYRTAASPGRTHGRKGVVAPCRRVAHPLQPDISCICSAPHQHPQSVVSQFAITSHGQAHHGCPANINFCHNVLERNMRLGLRRLSHRDTSLQNRNTSLRTRVTAYNQTATHTERDYIATVHDKKKRGQLICPLNTSNPWQHGHYQRICRYALKPEVLSLEGIRSSPPVKSLYRQPPMRASMPTPMLRHATEPPRLNIDA